jgi:hypothetical protein
MVIQLIVATAAIMRIKTVKVAAILNSSFFLFAAEEIIVLSDMPHPLEKIA